MNFPFSSNCDRIDDIKSEIKMYEDVLCSLESIMKSYKDNISKLYSENIKIDSKEHKILNLVQREVLDVAIEELNRLYYMYTAYLEQQKSYLNAALEHKNTKINDFNENLLTTNNNNNCFGE